MYDFDNDGWKDLFFALSHLAQAGSLSRDAIPCCRIGSSAISGASGSKTSRPAAGPDFQRAAMHRGVAFADFDNDGRIDAVVSVVNGPAKLFHNIIGRRIALAGGPPARPAARIVRDSAPSYTCGCRMAAICTTRRPPRWGTHVRAKPWCGSDWARIERRKRSRSAGRAAVSNRSPMWRPTASSKSSQEAKP